MRAARRLVDARERINATLRRTALARWRAATDALHAARLAAGVLALARAGAAARLSAALAAPAARATGRAVARWVGRMEAARAAERERLAAAMLPRWRRYRWRRLVGRAVAAEAARRAAAATRIAARARGAAGRRAAQSNRAARIGRRLRERAVRRIAAAVAVFLGAAATQLQRRWRGVVGRERARRRRLTLCSSTGAVAAALLAAAARSFVSRRGAASRLQRLVARRSRLRRWQDAVRAVLLRRREGAVARVQASWRLYRARQVVVCGWLAAARVCGWAAGRLRVSLG
jgi:hypothetical protein